MTARTRGPELRATTILAVRHRGRVVMAGDGQVTIGQTIMKSNARKLRRLYQDRVLAGFAGAGADALTLFERFEAKLQQVSGNLRRAAVDLAKDWRTDRLLRRLEALRSGEHTSELQPQANLLCRPLLEKKKPKSSKPACD